MKTSGAAWLLALVIARAGCRDRDARQEAVEARAGARERNDNELRYARFHARLRRHEQTKFVPFSSETQLRRYLDTVAALLRTRELDSSLSDAPQLLKPLPDRMRQLKAEPNPDLVAYRSMVGFMSDAPADGLSRFVRRDGRAYLLYANRLRSFDVDSQTGTLRLCAELTLGPPLPRRVERTLRNQRGETVHVARYDADALAGVAIFDSIFAIGGTLVALGTRQDVHAVEIVRIAVGASGDLRETDAHVIYYLPPEFAGYRAQVVHGALTLQLEHRAFYRPSSGGDDGYVYVLPARGAAHSGVPLRGLLRAQDVYQPLVHAYDTVLHPWLRCDLTAPQLSCRARAIPGPPAAAVHVGEDAFYTWLVSRVPDSGERADSVIVRVPLDGGPAGAVRVLGAPPSTAERPLHEQGGTPARDDPRQNGGRTHPPARAARDVLAAST